MMMRQAGSRGMIPQTSGQPGIMTTNVPIHLAVGFKYSNESQPRIAAAGADVTVLHADNPWGWPVEFLCKQYDDPEDAPRIRRNQLSTWVPDLDGHLYITPEVRAALDVDPAAK